MSAIRKNEIDTISGNTKNTRKPIPHMLNHDVRANIGRRAIAF